MTHHLKIFALPFEESKQSRRYFLSITSKHTSFKTFTQDSQSRYFERWNIKGQKYPHFKQSSYMRVMSHWKLKQSRRLLFLMIKKCCRQIHIFESKISISYGENDISDWIHYTCQRHRQTFNRSIWIHISYTWLFSLKIQNMWYWKLFRGKRIFWHALLYN